MIYNFSDLTVELWQRGQKGAQQDIDKQEFFKILFQKYYPHGVNNFFFSEKNILNRNADLKVHDPRVIFKSSIRKLYNNLDSYYSYNVILNDLIDNTKMYALTDFPTLGIDVVRLFAVYISPELQRRHKENSNIQIPVHIFFHPVGRIAEFQKDYYHQDGYIHNYYKHLVLDYLFVSHKLALQHHYAIKHQQHLDKPFNIPSLLIFPVFSKKAYDLFPNFFNTKVKTKISFFKLIESLIKKIFQSQSWNKIGYMALGGYSRGNDLILKSVLEALRDHKNKQVNTGSALCRSLFFFDPPSDFTLNTDYLNQWLNIEPNQDKSYKVYASSRTVFKTEIEKFQLNKNQLQNYVEVDLDQFNRKDKIPIDIIKNIKKYNGLTKPYEFYSPDLKKYYFIFTQNNFLYFLKTERNGGINLGNGHPFFHSHFVTHALANSKFP